MKVGLCIVCLLLSNFILTAQTSNVNKKSTANGSYIVLSVGTTPWQYLEDQKTNRGLLPSEDEAVTNLFFGAFLPPDPPEAVKSITEKCSPVIELFAGKRFGKRTVLNCKVNYCQSSYEYTLNNGDKFLEEAQFFTFGFGVNFEWGINEYKNFFSGFNLGASVANRNGNFSQKFHNGIETSPNYQVDLIGIRIKLGNALDFKFAHHIGVVIALGMGMSGFVRGGLSYSFNRE